jgi:hypothetical protein
MRRQQRWGSEVICAALSLGPFGALFYDCKRLQEAAMTSKGPPYMLLTIRRYTSEIFNRLNVRQKIMQIGRIPGRCIVNADDTGEARLKNH